MLIDIRQQQAGIAPDRDPVRAPVTADGPARQRLARVPLSLSMMKHASGGEALHHPSGQGVREPGLVGAHGLGVPFGAVWIVDGHEGRLAAHGEAHVGGAQLRIDRLAERVDAGPFLVGVRFGDLRLLAESMNRHHDLEGLLDPVVVRGRREREGTADRGRRLGIGRAGQGDVALAAEQTAGRVHSHPAGAGKEDLRPRVQVGDVLGDAGWPLQRFDIGLELDRISRGEARREPQVTEQLTQQPREVAARAVASRQRLLGGQDARLHPDVVAQQIVNPGVDIDQHVDRATPWPRIHRTRMLDLLGQQWPEGESLEIRRELTAQRRRISPGQHLGPFLQEEVEGIDDRQLGYQIDLHLQDLRRLGEYQARLVVPEGVLLPVHEVQRRTDLEGI